MAHTQLRQKVVGNPGNIIGFQLGKLAGNPGRKRSSSKMAKAKKSKALTYKKPAGYKKSNPGHSMAHHHHGKKHKKRSNPGGLSGSGGLTNSVTNALFVIVGALGSKLGAQAALGSNNVGPVGYFANAVAGGILWFATSKLMHNKAAADGVISGTMVQIILRVLNDYTPLGSYVSQLGMGDYQAQSFVTPQVLVDPLNSAAIAVPDGWGGQKVVMMPAAAAAAPAAAVGGGKASAAIPAASGMSGLYNGRGRQLYAA